MVDDNSKVGRIHDWKLGRTHDCKFVVWDNDALRYLRCELIADNDAL